MLVVQIMIWVGLGLAGGYLAAHKGYPPLIGIVGGVVFGPLGLVVAALMPATRDGRRQAKCERETQIELHEAREMRACPRCGRQNSVATPVCPRCEYRYSSTGVEVFE